MLVAQCGKWRLASIAQIRPGVICIFYALRCRATHARPPPSTQVLLIKDVILAKDVGCTMWKMAFSQHSTN